MPPRRGKTHKKSKTLKNQKVLTIPQLRKSLDHITEYTEQLVSSGTTSVKQGAVAFTSEWQKVFGKRLDTSTAENYIKHMMDMQKAKGKAKSKSTTRRKSGRGQRGGAQDTLLTGAPMDYITRPGVDLPYGNFLPYVKSGFWNPEQPHASEYSEFKTVLPYVGTGSNKMSGGGLIDTITNATSAILTRPFVAQNPPSVQQDVMSSWKGLPLGPGPDSYQATWKPTIAPGATLNIPIIDTYNRTLSNDVRTT
jgi:hypothetical protein